MSITAADFLKLAKDLLARSDEVAVRAAASRAYYAAYHACSAVRTKFPYAAGGRRGTHEALIEDLRGFLGDPADLQWKVRAIGAMLQNTKDSRVTADYHIDQEFPKKAAQDAFDMCEKIVRESTLALEMLDRLPPR